MKYLFLLVFMFSFCKAQESIDILIFTNQSSLTAVTGDTIASITSADSVEVLIGTTWKLLTQAVNDTAWVTSDDKSAENTITFILADETYWTHLNSLKFRIGGTITTPEIILPKSLNGRLTLDVVADTIGTNTDYGKSRLHGN